MLRVKVPSNVPASLEGTMENWDFGFHKFKHYPHFDAPISVKNVKNLVRNPEAVKRIGFFPFLRYYDEWQPFRKNEDGGKPSKKSRPISYAARRDAYVFMYYRYLISKKYEEKLIELGIEDAPIAYRKIPKSSCGGPGKCNIDFAKDAFDFVASLGDCVTVALDIEGYFDHLDHGCIEALWCELLGVTKLPSDHTSVFQAITQYSYVDQREAYRRLGYFGPKRKIGTRDIEGFLVPYKDMRKQLCTPTEFREKICGKGGRYKSLLRKNRKPYGIPQGSPISDLIANFYLLHFDVRMKKYAEDRGGMYLRYSDDILLILPGGKSVAIAAEDFATENVGDFGPKLRIKNSKTSIVQYNVSSTGLSIDHIKGKQGKNGLEYLGFRFDGKHVFIRDNTISRYYRKISMALSSEAHRLVEQYPTDDAQELMEKFNFSLFLERWNKVRNFKAVESDYHKWTFWTYVKRAAETFGGERQFFRQIRKSKKIIRNKLETKLEKMLN